MTVAQKPPSDPDPAFGCLLLAMGLLVAIAWAFGSAWHFWGPR
jgi:hypothetical protein